MGTAAPPPIASGPGRSRRTTTTREMCHKSPARCHRRGCPYRKPKTADRAANRPILAPMSDLCKLIWCTLIGLSGRELPWKPAPSVFEIVVVIEGCACARRLRRRRTLQELRRVAVARLACFARRALGISPNTRPGVPEAPSASWLNAVKGLLRRAHASAPQARCLPIRRRSQGHHQSPHADPKPLVWTATVLAAVKRGKQALESVH